MSKPIAAALLTAYYLLSIEVYLATYTIGTFQLSYWKFSPTELRILLAIGSIALLYVPIVKLAGSTCRLYDVGGVIGVTGLVLTLLASVVSHTLYLYRTERLP